MASSYIPYASRPGWQDLEPIPQKDAPHALVPIAYAEPYRDAMDTFRSLVQKAEMSTRGVELTEALIRMNPGHYSIWAYRAQTLLAIKADLTKELDLMDELIKEHLKSYQVWQHRRTIVIALDSSSREIPFTTRALAFDAKNYHTWAYRQWALLHFFTSSDTAIANSTSEPDQDVASASTAQQDRHRSSKVWDDELKYTQELLDKDVRNNSAWNHRFWVGFESGMGGDLEEVLERELRYVKDKLALSPNNPSAWNYLRGILKHTSTPLSTLSAFVRPLALGQRETATSPTDSTISEGAELLSWLAIEFLADVVAQEAKTNRDGEKAGESAAFDPIRTNYWLYRAEQVESVA
ncbi:BQ2448_5082 [Microbotryum intermedium]|uniref:Protein farnesyltransferase/geranylgeranyltransferase type-1 subunit alpha n=1 Tax=Microbotryum intermedium TaxID=269621 RepID=A0A238F615_9BASI|nr:BQ2448_5082 [Microbotryum intermedium]